ncbi:hypothetical protein HDZ31DRAFT_33788 [Schizophyllum fasciatum]
MTTPAEEDLKQALIELKSQNPALGISKVHGLLLAAHPEWTVSEKRTRKILQSQGLVQSAGPAIHPTSRLIPDLDVKKYTTKVAPKYFDKRKGKGLIAVEPISEGETIWKEDPFVLATEWEVFELQVQGAACWHCSTPLQHTGREVSCRADTSSSNYCPARFCNRLCLVRSDKTHPLLCPAQNSASSQLLRYAHDKRWMALHGYAQLVARIMLAAQGDPATFKAELDIMRSFAEIGMEDRLIPSHSPGQEPDREAWRKGYQHIVHTFLDPPTAEGKKKLKKIIRKPLSPELEKELFDYDTAFLKGLGRMALNFERHGGLYVLHSHMNHSCSPNVSVRHFDQRTALSRITMVAKADIAPGEELVVTYVDPELPYHQRQEEVEQWGFRCDCARCLEEAKVAKTTAPTNNEPRDGLDMSELERELKAGLGVM